MVEPGRFLEMRRKIETTLVIWSSLIGGLPPGLARAPSAPPSFVIVGSDFHTRGQEDAGEMRLCLRNTGTAPFSMAQLKVRITAGKPDSAGPADVEQKCVYARLWPPVLPPGQYGQLVAKLLDRPPSGRTLTCTLSVEGTASCTLPASEPILWISYIGFSQNLRTIFVYLENGTDEVVQLKSLQINEDKIEDPAGAVNRLVPAKDKGCLAGRLSPGITPGQFVHVTVSARKGNQDVRLHSIVKAIDKVPLMMVESDSPTPDLGLDLEGFTETMTCIAHAHGTHEQAAGKFLEDYVQWFHRNPHQVIQVDICRSDSPRAWFQFGSLPDVARMNPILSPPSGYDQQDHKQWFHPFLYRGHLAKKAVEPCRYLAVMPIVPEEGLFLQKEFTPPELRFLVYCAIASGAKGLGYRGVLPDDPLNRSAFIRLNKELRQIEPLLLIGEPVDWAATTESNYAVRSLLCGNQTILVLIFDRRYFGQQRGNKFYTPAFARAVTQARVDVKIPGEVSVGQVRSLSAPLDRGAWVYREGILRFTTHGVESVQIYLVDLQSRPGPANGGEPSL